jgi:hypothetical protein
MPNGGRRRSSVAYPVQHWALGRAVRLMRHLLAQRNGAATPRPCDGANRERGGPHGTQGPSCGATRGTSAPLNHRVASGSREPRHGPRSRPLHEEPAPASG